MVDHLANRRTWVCLNYKGAFRDALALHYGWRPSNMAMTCVCDKSNDVQQPFSCRVGGLPIHRHNDIGDLSTSLISEVCTNTEIEPALHAAPYWGKARHADEVQMSKMKPDLTFVAEAFGNLVKMHFSIYIYGYSIPLQHQTRIEPTHFSYTASISKKSGDPTTRGFKR